MKRIAICACLLIVACGDDAQRTTDCPVLPRLESVCFGISFDSLKQVRPGAFLDSDGVREVPSDSTSIVYYFSGTSGDASGVLMAVRIDLLMRAATPEARASHLGEIAAGTATIVEGYLRVPNPWSGDSLNVPASLLTLAETERVIRWDAFASELRTSRISVWAYERGTPPESMGRWTD